MKGNKDESCKDSTVGIKYIKWTMKFHDHEIRKITQNLENIRVDN